ncbi:MAG: ABC transporter permease, partial [Cloacibacillus sp.]
MKIAGKNKNLLLITLVLLALWSFFTIRAPQAFLSGAIYMTFLSTVPFITIVATAMTLVVVTGEMDLSFASNMAMSGFVFAWAARATGSVYAGVAAGLAAGTAIGFINGAFIVSAGVPAIVATIGFDFFWRGLVMLLSDGTAIPLDFIVGSPALAPFIGSVGGVLPMQSVWALVFALVTTIIYHRTRWGDDLRFIGDDRSAARMLGITVERSRACVFAYLGFAAGLAGILATMEMGNWWPTQGDGYLLLVFASVFLGGTSVYGGSGTV